MSTPVVQIARYAGVVRASVVRIARCGQRDRVLGVIQIAARCAGVILCRCGALAAAELHRWAAAPIRLCATSRTFDESDSLLLPIRRMGESDSWYDSLVQNGRIRFVQLHVGRLGRRGRHPFSMVMSQSRFGNARGARLVAPVPVVLAWFARAWCGLPVVPGVIVCWAWF